MPKDSPKSKPSIKVREHHVAIPATEEELETVVVTATLGSNDDGGAYLGISYLPLRMMHMGEYMEGMMDDMPDFYGRGFPFARPGMEGMPDHMGLTVPQSTDL